MQNAWIWFKNSGVLRKIHSKPTDLLIVSMFALLLLDKLHLLTKNLLKIEIPQNDKNKLFKF